MRVKPHHTNTQDHKKARALRRQISPLEKKLWFALRKAVAGTSLKFRRQQPIHPYIADFACMKVKLLIELDGCSHDSRQAYDRARDAYLKGRGYAILRINNDDVVHNLPSVIETILTEAETLAQKCLTANK